MKINNIDELFAYITKGEYLLNNNMQGLISDCYKNGDTVEEHFTTYEDEDENEKYVDIYQYFMTSLNEHLEEYLKLEDAPLPVFYIEKYDLYIIGVTVFGMSWELAECDIELFKN